jgi:hypothetical protein
MKPLTPVLAAALLLTLAWPSAAQTSLSTSVGGNFASFSEGASASTRRQDVAATAGLEHLFNGERGRLEVRDYERQPWTPPEETEIELTRSFGQRERIAVPVASGGHGGGDDVLRDLIFRGKDVADYMRLPDSRAGALSCLTGIAARTSVEQGRPIRIADLCPV